MARNPRTGQMELTKEAKSAERRPDESELDYYERRYKERVMLILFIRFFSPIKLYFLFNLLR